MIGREVLGSGLTASISSASAYEVAPKAWIMIRRRLPKRLHTPEHIVLHSRQKLLGFYMTVGVVLAILALVVGAGSSTQPKAPSPVTTTTSPTTATTASTPSTPQTTVAVAASVSPGPPST